MNKDNNEKPFGLLNQTEFASDLMQALVDRGLGTLPSREVAIAIVEQLLLHHPAWKTDQPPVYELARTLRMSPRRLRGILDDISYRDTSRTEPTLR